MRSRITGTLVLLLFAISVVSTGCEHSKKRRNSLFKEAERHFERGEYEAALDDYQAFLHRYPRSPLAETVKMRKKTVNHEVQSILSRDDMPEPRYVGEQNVEAEPLGVEKTSGVDQPDAGSGDAE